MFFKQFATRESLLSYLFGCIGHGKAIAVDVVAGDDVGNVRVQVLHTPGHTPESVCLLVKDLRRGDAPWFVLTGDTLFVGAVGRPDLAGRETEMADQLYKSLHPKLSMTREDFVTEVTSTLSPPPAEMASILAANTQG